MSVPVKIFCHWFEFSNIFLQSSLEYFQTSLSLSLSEDTSEVSEVVTEWFKSEETTEEDVDTPDAGTNEEEVGDGEEERICGTFVWPNSVLLKLAGVVEMFDPE